MGLTIFKFLWRRGRLGKLAVVGGLVSAPVLMVAAVVVMYAILQAESMFEAHQKELSRLASLHLPPGKTTTEAMRELQVGLEFTQHRASIREVPWNVAEQSIGTPAWASHMIRLWWNVSTGWGQPSPEDERVIQALDPCEIIPFMACIDPALPKQGPIPVFHVVPAMPDGYEMVEPLARLLQDRSSEDVSDMCRLVCWLHQSGKHTEANALLLRAAEYIVRYKPCGEGIGNWDFARSCLCDTAVQLHGMGLLPAEISRQLLSTLWDNPPQLDWVYQMGAVIELMAWERAQPTRDWMNGWLFKTWPHDFIDSLAEMRGKLEYSIEFASTKYESSTHSQELSRALSRSGVGLTVAEYCRPPQPCAPATDPSVFFGKAVRDDIDTSSMIESLVREASIWTLLAGTCQSSTFGQVLAEALDIGRPADTTWGFILAAGRISRASIDVDEVWAATDGKKLHTSPFRFQSLRATCFGEWILSHNQEILTLKGVGTDYITLSKSHSPMNHSHRFDCDAGILTLGTVDQTGVFQVLAKGTSAGAESLGRLILFNNGCGTSARFVLMTPPEDFNPGARLLYPLDGIGPPAR